MFSGPLPIFGKSGLLASFWPKPSPIMKVLVKEKKSHVPKSGHSIPKPTFPQSTLGAFSQPG